MNTDRPYCGIGGHHPVASESRMCFGLAWFETEEQAVRYGATVRTAGQDQRRMAGRDAM